MALRDQILAQWGNMGEWSAGGVDRAQELADYLAKAGITDLSQLSIKETPDAFTTQGGIDSSGNPLNQSTQAGRQLMVGDKALGYLGNYNLDGSIGGNEGQYLQDNERLGWSARGEGNVSYNVVNTPNGPAVVPAWGSSSDADTVRDLIKGGLMVGGIAYGANALAGAGGAGAGSTVGMTGAEAATGMLGTEGLTASQAGGLLGGGSTVGMTGAEAASAAGGLGQGSGIGTLASEAATYSALPTVSPIGQTAGVTLADIGVGSALTTPTIASQGMQWGQMLKDYGPLVTSVLGAASGARDQTQSASKEPWAAAQPFLKDVLSRAGGMLPNYLDNPISPEQRQAMNNVFGLTNAGMNAVPGLLANMNAAGGGYNRRGGADRTRVNFTPLNFNAGGLLGNFTPGGR